MSKYRKLPSIDPCKVNLRRLKKLSADQLMNVWARLGMSQVDPRNKARTTLKHFVANYATAKRVQSIYKNDPVQRRHATRVYLKISKGLERQFKAIAKQKCSRR